ncbi:MAG TPA: sugar transferase [Patescibacteria group bacterium]|nr:sugar transferase [Patescibacteria group bacterium]
MNQLQGEAWVESSQKRAMDLALATTLVPLAAPLVLGAAGLIRSIDGVDPLYNAERFGQNEDLFTMYKLRTMPSVNGAETVSSGYDDPRASRLGKVLRKIRLDEVPQIYNIYRGEMTVVGPRPIATKEYERIMDSLDPMTQKEWRKARALCRPGMLDSFGVQAYRCGYDLDSQKRVETDIEYASAATLQGDIKIIVDSLGLFSTLFAKHDRNITPPKHEYKRGSAILAAAANGNGITVSAQQRQYWNSMFRFAKVMDGLVDEQGETDLTPYIDRAFRGEIFAGLELDLALQVKASISLLSDDHRERIRHAISLLPVFAAKKQAATTPKGLHAVCMEEALCFASLLELDDVGDDVGVAKFNKWVRYVAQAGESLDAAADLQADYTANAVQLKPSRINAMRLAGRGLNHALHVARLSNRQTNTAIMHAAWVCCTDH